jgi:hypothetical protein
MKQELMNLFLFIFICFIIYLIFRNFNFNKNYSIKEGMTDASGNTITAPPNGIAGNAANYGAVIKGANIKLQDTFLISKYRSDYETVILNLDDLLNNLMLKTALTIDTDKPDESIQKLSNMNQAKLALNNVMKFVDATK